MKKLRSEKLRADFSFPMNRARETPATGRHDRNVGPPIYFGSLVIFDESFPQNYCSG